MTSFLQYFLNIGQDGLHLLATAVLPVLFPFFVITSLILNLTNSKKPWVVMLLAYCSGYPNGARLTQNLYIKQRINLQQAKNLTIMTSTPSPIFVIATAGTLFLKDTRLGCIIFCCTIIAALFNGWIWQSDSYKEETTNQYVTQPKTSVSFFQAFGDALTNATTSILNVCGVVLFFYIFTRLLCLPTLLSGLLEMTTGVSRTLNPFLIQFFVTFGGFSVAMQQQIFLQNFQIKFSTYLVYKTTHAILACALLSICFLFLY